MEGEGSVFPCQVSGQRDVVIWPSFAPLQADLASAVRLLHLVQREAIIIKSWKTIYFFPSLSEKQQCADPSQC